MTLTLGRRLLDEQVDLGQLGVQVGHLELDPVGELGRAAGAWVAIAGACPGDEVLAEGRHACWVGHRWVGFSMARIGDQSSGIRIQPWRIA